MTTRSIEDRAGEALRRWKHGEMRPLWADMPEGPRKDEVRRAAASLIEFMGRCGLEVKLKEGEGQ
jgi:hypothetical protein